MQISALFLFSLFDIMKGFCTAFYQNGILVEDKKEVALYYLRTGFKYDLIALCPLIFNRIYFPSLNLMIMFLIEMLYFLKAHVMI